MSQAFEIVTVDASNVQQSGFFCYKSKPKSPGYQRKLSWLHQRFAEGMRIKLACTNGRSIGFIEYIPGEYAWRVLDAAGYMVIHCLWVVGKGKGQGGGSQLLETCVEDARRAGLDGVAMVTSRGNWLAGAQLLLKHGFEAVDAAPPAFQLLVRRFGRARPPTFPTNWDERLQRYGDGLTVFRSDQCPYLDNAVAVVQKAGQAQGLSTTVVELQSAPEVRDLAPSAYGVFGIAYKGQLLSYHYLSEQDLSQRLVGTSSL